MSWHFVWYDYVHPLISGQSLGLELGSMLGSGLGSGPWLASGHNYRVDKIRYLSHINGAE